MDDLLEASWACLAGWGALRRAPRALGFWKKIADSHVDSYFCFQTRFFAILKGFGTDFGRVWEAKIDIKIEFFRKRRFCENRCFSQGKLLFLRFRASKIR